MSTMGLNLMASIAEGGAAANGSNPVDFTHLPNNILEALVPGYSVISRFILDIFGFVSLCVLVFGAVTAVNYAYRHVRALTMTYLTASVTVDAHDDIFTQLVLWISDHKVATKSRALKVKSGIYTTWDSDDDEPNEMELSIEDIGDGGLLNFNHWEMKVPPRFEPLEEPQWFWHKGHYFRFRMDQETLMNNSGYLRGVLTNDKKLTITVFGRSTQPIKDLITEVRNNSIKKQRYRTAVRRPGPKEYRVRGYYPWSKVATRPSRPIDTVVLDHQQKQDILLDINEYLKPSTPRWYANRGIPYRRGYLFYGPPGTGKTSLSFAIAGVFGLDIFCISLLEPTLTEEELGTLFNNLPRRCVVLLEDIDTAGLHRNTEEDDTSEEKKNKKKKKEEKKKKKKDKSSNATSDSATSDTDKESSVAAEVAKALKSVSKDRKNRHDNDDNKGISLSGLLNAIDGVASHEGRILVMTTNHPEKLDSALIRPGRVDMKIEFTLATTQQIEEIFVRMYSSDKIKKDALHDSTNSIKPKKKSIAKPASVSPPPYQSIPINSAMSTKSNGIGKPSIPSPPVTPTDESSKKQGFPPSSMAAAADIPSPSDLEDVGLDSLAKAFSAAIPENVFSPAEIQGYLLTWKKDPTGAVAGARKWRDEALKAKCAKEAAKEAAKEDKEVSAEKEKVEEDKET